MQKVTYHGFDPPPKEKVGHPIYLGVYGIKSKKDSKDQESIQSSTTPVLGYQMGK